MAPHTILAYSWSDYDVDPRESMGVHRGSEGEAMGRPTMKTIGLLLYLAAVVWLDREARWPPRPWAKSSGTAKCARKWWWCLRGAS